MSGSKLYNEEGISLLIPLDDQGKSSDSLADRSLARAMMYNALLKNIYTLQALPGVVPVCFLKNWTKAEEQEKLSASAIS